MNGFRKFSRTWWVLASADGCLLARGHPDPKMPPYHLDAMEVCVWTDGYEATDTEHAFDPEKEAKE